MRAVVGMLLAVAEVATAAPAPPRLIVKYRTTMPACVQCLVQGGVRFATVTGTPSLDALHAELGVTGARPLFRPSAEADGATRSAAHTAWIAGVRSRFALRATRRAPGVAAPDLSRLYVLSLGPGIDADTAAARYASDPDVEYAQPDRIRSTTFTPDDPFFLSAGSWGQSYPDLWGLRTAEAEAAWNTSAGEGTVVAVVDTGIDATHPDLAANVWGNEGEVAGNGRDDDNNGFADDVQGWDFVHGDGKPTDDHGHGTHVAGTAAAVGGNGVGVVGMAWGARVMGVKALDANGQGFDSDLAQGIVYAAANGADVINCSFGGLGTSPVLEDAIATAVGLGVVVVAAAGNSASSFVDRKHFVPAGLPGVIAVGATAPGDALASFSNDGEGVSVTAPGVDVLSLRASGGTFGGEAVSDVVVASRYVRFQGTSMAAPHVAGLAALLLAADPGLGTQEVRWRLEAGARQPGYAGYEGLSWNPFFGWGRIDAARALAPPAVRTRVRVFDPPSTRVTDLVRPRGGIVLHALAGIAASAVGSADVSFTTAAPVSWTLSAPAWLVPAASGGQGPARVDLTAAVGGLSPGRLTGQVTVSAPVASDGGASVPAVLEVHPDVRLGPARALARDVPIPGAETAGAPRLASNGSGATLAVWASSDGVFTTRIGPDDAVARSVEVVGEADFGVPATADVAALGESFLVVWATRSTGQSAVNAARVGPDGSLVDVVPFVLETARGRRAALLRDVRVAGDRDGWTVVWAYPDRVRRRAKVYVRRVGPDGSLTSPRRKLCVIRWPFFRRASPGFSVYDFRPEMRVRCTATRCLLAWWQFEAAESAIGKNVHAVYGLRIAGTQLLDPRPFRILTDAERLAGVASDGTDWAVLAWREKACPGPRYCGDEILAARVTAGGAARDPAGIRLNEGPPTGSPSALPTDLGFDGLRYVATFVAPRPFVEAPAAGGNVFLARMTPDGIPLGTGELEGVLVYPGGSAGSASVAATGAHTVVAWSDLQLHDGSRAGTPFDSIWMQRVQPAP